MLLIASASFGLGKISRLEEGRRSVEIYQPERVGERVESPQPVIESAKALQPVAKPQPASAVSASTASTPGPESVVGSKNGKKYHFPWCSGAKRITETNKIVFENSEEARKAGYTPAANCKGLK